MNLGHAKYSISSKDLTSSAAVGSGSGFRSSVQP